MTHPDRIGKYIVKRELGSGENTRVYLVYDAFFNADIALKVYDVDMGDAQSLTRSQFLNESSLVGKLEHPHIAAILDAFSDGNVTYVAMEYVPGTSLYAHAQPDKLMPIEEVIEIGFKCCGALDYAFRQGIVHRDLKPSNILVDHGTDIKVADFGAAFIRGAQHTQMMDVGTPSYSSPEQIRGDDLTYRSDIYSLGVVLYVLLTGTRPFEATNATALFHKILTEAPPAPSSRRWGIAPELDAIVLRAMAKSPEDRFPDWAEFALALAKVGGLGAKTRTVSDSEKYTRLRDLALLEGFEDAEVWELVRASVWRRAPSQTAIVREGDIGTSLFILTEGEAAVTANGRLLNVLGVGECFGEMAYIRGDNAPRGATILATTDVTVAEFELSALAALSMSCQLRLVRALLRSLADRLTLSNARISRSS
jgi:CRP-like cAMP-binding protein/predicted Ser/Thr protein kinase